jgi:hypothetical protein
MTTRLRKTTKEATPDPARPPRTRIIMATADAAALSVKSSATHDEACERLAGFRALRQEVEKLYDRMLKPLNEKRKVILGWKNDDLQSVKTAEVTYTEKISDWREADRKRKVKAAAKKQVEAAKKADAEHSERLSQLRKAAAEEDDELAAMALAEEAEALDAAGAASPVIPFKKPTYENASVVERRRWTVRVTDLRELAAAVGSGDVPVSVIKADLSVLNKQATAMGKDLEQIYPGVAVSQSSSFARRAAAPGGYK